MLINQEKKSLEIHGRLFKDDVPNYRMLSELMDFPGPIERYYGWPSIYDNPMKAQVATCNFMLKHRRGYVLNDIGTGKTLCMDWLADYLIQEGEVKSVLIISPLSTLQSVHANELYFSLPHLTWGILHGSKKKRLQELAKPKDIYIINYDGLKVIGDEIYKRKDINCIFIDEVAILRNRRMTSKREMLNEGRAPTLWQTVEALFGAHRKDILVWGFTGSPMPKAPTDCYGQARIINPEALPQRPNYRTKIMEPISFSRFRDLVMTKFGDYTWKPREGWEKVCADVLQPSIRFTRDDCLDLPDCTTVPYEIALTSQQKTLYNDMLKKLSVEVNNQEITAVNAGVKIQKLIQIASGAIYDEDGTSHKIDFSNRLKVLKELINAAHPYHVLVFMPFKNMLIPLEKELQKEFGFVAHIDQNVTTKKRSELFTSFQHGNLRVLLAIPSCMAHGLNLQYQCSTVVWWAPINRYDIYEQANGRIIRSGQKRKQLIMHLQGTPAERKQYASLKYKEGNQVTLLDVIKQGRV